MASTSIHAPKARLLRELLEEQQEPFVLDVYLLERGHSKKIRDSDTSKDGWINSVLKNRERSPKRSKRMKSILARVFFGKASGGSNYDRKACNVERFGDFGIGSDMGRETQVEELHQLSSASFCNADMEREIEVAEIDRFSSASYTTLFDSSSEGNMEEFSSTKHNPFPSTDSFGVLKLNTMKDKVSTDGRHQSIEDSKQFSPVSVLEIPFEDGSPGNNQMQFFPRIERRNPTVSSFNLDKEAAKDPVLTTSMWEHFVHSLTEQEELHGFSSSSVCLTKTKRMLQQRRQLLRELVERNLQKGTRCQVLESAEIKNIEKIIFDQIFSWEKQGGSSTNITQMLGYDLKEAKQEWDHFRQETTGIQVDIADAIFEEITNEIVVHMLDSFELERCQ
ncbi:hypothetical protein MRB53_018006 [Persea americana]|uniref:Uncharacterized protein n=1 Tax=Persea americana TaxID=3435 RepID=A0ACC2M823_PERAE|nr:hypothetical protein MRB53_018006 [Persea americana]